MRFKPLSLALLFLLGVSQAMALELGDVAVLSRLGQPLQAEVQLLEGAGEIRLGAQCFTVSQGRDSDAKSGRSSLGAGRVALTRIDDPSRLLIVSDHVIDEPVLPFNLRVVCGPFQQRSYTVLMESVFSSPLRVAPSAPKSSRSALETGLSPKEKRTAPGPEWQCAEGESARSIAASIFPNNSSAQSRFLSALLTANSDMALGAGGEKRLAGGTVLRLPETRHLPTGKPVKVAKPPALAASSSAVSSPPPSVPPAKVPPLSTAPSNGSAALPVGEAQALAEQIHALEASLSASALATKSIERPAAAPPSGIEPAESPPALRVVPVAPTPQSALPTPPPVAVPAVTAKTLPAPVPTATQELGLADFLLEIVSARWRESSAVLGLLVLLLLWRSTRQRRARRVRSIKPTHELAAHPLAQRDPMSIIEEDARSAIKTSQARHSAGMVLPSAEVAVVVEENKALPEQTAAPLAIKEDREFNPVMELAEIMLSFGRVKGAAQALQEYIEKSPDEALQPWMKLLEVYRQGDMREEFSSVSEKLKLHFNVAPADWDSMGERASQPAAPIDEDTASIEQLLTHLPNIARMSRIRDEVTRTWDSPEGFEYLNSLLRDNRAGERQGFPLATVSELLYLMNILEKRLSHLPP